MPDGYCSKNIEPYAFSIGTVTIPFGEISSLIQSVATLYAQTNFMRPFQVVHDLHMSQMNDFVFFSSRVFQKEVYSMRRFESEAKQNKNGSADSQVLCLFLF